MLASDGSVRWTGAPVGKLIAGDDVLRPRLRVIADEQLTGASREAVQTRLDLWLKNHIERLLGAAVRAGRGRRRHRHRARRRLPVDRVDRRAGARRRWPRTSKVSTSRRARCCANTACASAPIISICRRCSSPRRAASRRSSGCSSTASPEDKGLDELQRLASSGRTSIPVDKDTPKPLYRTIGYRVCGERAIRVDILERLADLIRPALAWREGVVGRKAGRRVQRLRLHRHRRDDVADRRVGRGLRLDPALARLSHGEAAQTGRSRMPATAGGGEASARRSRGARGSRADAATPATEATEAESRRTRAELGARRRAAERAPDEAVASEPPAETAPSADVPPADRSVPAEARRCREAAAAERRQRPVKRPQRCRAEAASGRCRCASGSRRARDDRGVAARPPAGRAPSSRRRAAWPPSPPNGRAQSPKARPRAKRRRLRLPTDRPSPEMPRRRPTASARNVTAVRATAAAIVASARTARARLPKAPSSKRRPAREQRQDRPPRPDGSGRPERRDRPDRKEGPAAGRRGADRDRDRDRDRGAITGRDRIWGSSEEPRSNKEPDPNSPFAKLLALKAQLEGNKER